MDNPSASTAACRPGSGYPQLPAVAWHESSAGGEVLKDAAVAAEASRRKCKRIRWPEHFVSPNQAYEFVLDFVFLVVLQIFGFCARLLFLAVPRIFGLCA